MRRPRFSLTLTLACCGIVAGVVVCVGLWMLQPVDAEVDRG